MTVSRIARLSISLVALAVAPDAGAGNASNYVHLINGIDQFYGAGTSGQPGAGPANGAFRGVWRCFPGKMLHSPTLVVDAASPLLGSYATKVNSIHVVVGGSAGKVFRFPTIALTSSPGDCRFLTTAGTPNFGVFSVANLGPIVGGPLTTNQGPATVSFLGGVTNFVLTNPTPAWNFPVKIAFRLSGGAIGVPEAESLTLWVQDDPNQFGPGTRQYWTRSIDERNLCDSYSFLLDGAGTMFHLAPNEEWGLGFGTIDATLSAAITSLGPGPTGMNAHHAGFAQPYDLGSGTRTISITGSGGTGPGMASLGSEILGFAVYDEIDALYGGPLGSWQLVCANLWGAELTGQPTCSRRVSTFTTFPTGGPGGPVLDAGLPEMPRSVGKCDTLCATLHSNIIWIAATNFRTPLGGLNCPYFPVPAANSGSTGNNGGFAVPVPPFPPLVGLQLYFWSLNVDPTDTFLHPGADGGHHLTNGYDVLFFP
ncbi:MAG: hypothetical protein ACF8XB_20095 [Planctomycetota bacterium JB042]